MSPRNGPPAGSTNGKFGPDFPGTHFLGDLLQLSFASSQRDLFEEGWLEFVARVYWLKARFLALQVCTLTSTNTPFLLMKYLDEQLGIAHFYFYFFGIISEVSTTDSLRQCCVFWLFWGKCALKRAVLQEGHEQENEIWAKCFAHEGCIYAIFVTCCWISRDFSLAGFTEMKNLKPIKQKGWDGGKMYIAYLSKTAAYGAQMDRKGWRPVRRVDAGKAPDILMFPRVCARNVTSW